MAKARTASALDLPDETDVATGAASIYFGPDRLSRVKARARARGLKLSAYVALLADLGLDLSPDQMKRLEALAVIKRTTVSALVSSLISDLIG